MDSTILTIYICSYLPSNSPNTNFRKRKLKNFLKKQHKKGNWYEKNIEYIIIGQGDVWFNSTFKTEIQSISSNIKINVYKEPLGLAGARNECLNLARRSNKKWICIQDDDTATFDFLYNSHEVFEVINETNKYDNVIFTPIYPSIQGYKRFNLAYRDVLKDNFSVCTSNGSYTFPFVFNVQHLPKNILFKDTDSQGQFLHDDIQFVAELLLTTDMCFGQLQQWICEKDIFNHTILNDRSTDFDRDLLKNQEFFKQRSVQEVLKLNSDENITPHFFDKEKWINTKTRLAYTNAVKVFDFFKKVKLTSDRNAEITYKSMCVFLIPRKSKNYQYTKRESTFKSRPRNKGC